MAKSSQKAPKHKKVKIEFDSRLLLAIGLIAMGILLIVGGVSSVQQLISIAITVIGVVFIVLGLIDVLHKDYPVGFFRIVIGIVVILLGWFLYWIAFIVYAAITLLAAIGTLLDKNSDKFGAIVQIVVSVFMLLFAFGSKFAWSIANILTYVTGAIMILDGLYVLYQLTFGSYVKKSRR